MAVDVCSEISSPRISFSHDLNELDFIPVEKSHQSPSDFDFNFIFNFCTGEKPAQISSADELFADGKILPIQINKTHPISNKPDPISNRPDPISNRPDLNTETTVRKRLIEFLSTNFDGGDGDGDEKPPAKPFWQQFRRSSSVNGENGRRIGNVNGTGLLRSLHFLTRSNSTGSVPNPNPNNNQPSPIPKIVIRKQQSLKERSISVENSYAPPFNYYKNNPSTLRKSRSYGNGVRVSPVLNINPVYIARGSVGLFGIGSFFCSKKSQKKKKRK